jgi:cardiolipin synthase A/B
MSRMTKSRRRWHDKRVAKRWRYRLAPDARSRPPKGLPGLGMRLRRLLWSWWPWAIVFLLAMVDDRWYLAASTGMMAAFSYLIAPKESPPRFGLDHAFAVADEEFLPTMGGATGAPFARGSRIEILNNGDEFYPAMLEAIEDAAVSINIEAYIYWAGKTGKRFALALADRGRAGVTVKILLDAVGSTSIGEDILRVLEAGKCQVAWYNPIHWYTIGRYNHRTHRKSLIIDGDLAFTGGAGIADQWEGHAQDPAHWRDIQLRVEGPAVTPLQTGFADNWLLTTGELISGPQYYPPVDRTGALIAQTIISSPEVGASTVRVMYYLSIVCARQSIFIANPYFVPDQAGVDALVDAKRRGVDVRIMVSGAYNDNWLARQNSVRLYRSLLNAGIEILEFNQTMLHQKTMVVDALWATVGTTNFDNRSFAHNEENNVCVYDAAWARRLHDIFLADAGRCDRVTLEAWQKRGVVARAAEIVASLVQDQI